MTDQIQQQSGSENLETENLETENVETENPETEDPEVENPETEDPESQDDQPTMLWYVLRVASNREEQVRDAMLQKVQIDHIESEVGRIVVPTEKVKRVRGTQHRVYERKLYPGYIFIEMALAEDGNVPEKAWFLIKETTGVGDFIGTEGKPSHMSDTEVAKMLGQIEDTEDAPTIQMEFKKDDHIKIKGGAFEGYEGNVDAIDNEKGTVRVIVTIFGRETPLDIEYWQLEKV